MISISRSGRMLGLGFDKQKKKHSSSSRSVLKLRDDSPDSVIFTQDSNIFSSASASVDRCSFASDVHDHDSLVSELSKHLDGSDVNECSSGPDLEQNNRSTVHKSGNKAKDLEEQQETEDDNETSDSARNSFSRALRECQILRFRSEVHTTLKKADRRRPASLDLNNTGTNVIAVNRSPRFGGMKKSSASTKKTSTFHSPGTPNYWQGASGVQKGWSSERVPLPQNGSRRNMGAALLPLNSGRTLPSKWEDAEKWICSPVSGDGGFSRALVPLPQRRQKSKSGPLGPTGAAFYSMYSPAMPIFERGNGVGFMPGSPFSTGVLVADRFPSQGQHNVGYGDDGYPVQTEPSIARSASVHGWSSDRLTKLLPSSQDEKIDGIEEESTLISRAVSRRDMATQMSPDGSTHSSSRGRLSFSSSPPPFLPKVDLDGFHSSKLEVRDVQVDDRVTMTRWSRKHGARGPERGFANVEDLKKKSVEDLKKKPLEVRASTCDVSDAAKCMAKATREEAKITAWENLQKAKAEAALRKLEMKLEKKRSSSIDKIMNKLGLAQQRAQDMRSSMSDKQSHQSRRTSTRIISFRKRTQISSLSGCFTCHAF